MYELHLYLIKVVFMNSYIVLFSITHLINNYCYRVVASGFILVRHSCLVFLNQNACYFLTCMHVENKIVWNISIHVCSHNNSKITFHKM